MGNPDEMPEYRREDWPSVSEALAKALADGTVVCHYIIDEPFTPLPPEGAVG